MKKAKGATTLVFTASIWAGGNNSRVKVSWDNNTCEVMSQTKYILDIASYRVLIKVGMGRKENFWMIEEMKESLHQRVNYLFLGAFTPMTAMKSNWFQLQFDSKLLEYLAIYYFILVNRQCRTQCWKNTEHCVLLTGSEMTLKLDMHTNTHTTLKVPLFLYWEQPGKRPEWMWGWSNSLFL